MPALWNEHATGPTEPSRPPARERSRESENHAVKTRRPTPARPTTRTRPFYEFSRIRKRARSRADRDSATAAGLAGPAPGSSTRAVASLGSTLRKTAASRSGCDRPAAPAAIRPPRAGRSRPRCRCSLLAPAAETPFPKDPPRTRRAPKDCGHVRPTRLARAPFRRALARAAPNPERLASARRIRPVTTPPAAGRSTRSVIRRPPPPRPAVARPLGRTTAMGRLRPPLRPLSADRANGPGP